MGPEILTPTSIVVYSRQGCCLCDEALALLEVAQARWNFTVVTVDIEAEPAWFARYRYRVPVVLIGGVERLALRLDAAALDAALRASGVEPRR